MNILQRMMRAVGRWFASSLQNPAQWFVDWIRGAEGESDSGVAVNGKTVLSYAPIWHLVSRIAGHLAQIPCHVHEVKSDRESVVAKRHPAYKLVKWRANKLMNADVFRETLQAHALLWGNGRAAIQRNNRNDPAELIILLPDRTVTVLVNDEKWHVVTMEDGSKVRIADEDVFHIPGLGFDGIQGYSLIEMAKNSIGLGLASEKSASVHFKNNGTPGLVLEAPRGTFRDEKEAKEFMKNWNEYHNGVDNTNKAALMREGMKATALSMKASESQWIEQRKFQRQEAALWLVCEQILGDDSSVSYNSLEQKNLAYLTNCLNRWLVRWELELREKLLTGLQKRQESHYFKFNRNALLAMSANERADFYTKMRAIEAISANEVREKEDMPPYDGGDNYDNPAINPKGTEGEQPETNDEPKPDQPEAFDMAAFQVAMQAYAETLAARMPVPQISVAAPVVNVEARGPSEAVTRQLVCARIKEVIAVESHRAIEAATKQKNFLAWLEDFYSDNGFLPRLKAVWQQCGGRVEQVAAYADESKAVLFEVAGAASQEQLPAAVATATEHWSDRADMQAGMILGSL